MQTLGEQCQTASVATPAAKTQVGVICEKVKVQAIFQ